jgi:hypothetical protein
MGNVGAGGRYAGRIIGLQPTLDHLAKYGSTYVGLGQIAAKDFNDGPASTVVGTRLGQVVRSLPRTARWTTTITST